MNCSRVKLLPVKLEIIHYPKMHFPRSQVNGILELLSERVIDGKNSGFGFKTDAGAKTVRGIIPAAGERDTLIFIVGAITEKIEVGVFFQQITIFKSEDVIGRSKDGFFVKTTQSFQAADSE